MTLSQKSIIGSIDVLVSGHVQVRRDDLVLNGEDLISKTHHRHTLAPGDDLTSQDPRVQAIAAAAWTPKLMAQTTAAIVAQSALETAERNAAKAVFEKANADAEAVEQAALKAKAAAKAAAEAAIAAIPQVPAGAAQNDGSVDDLQIRLAMTEMGLRDAVEAAVAKGDQTLQDWYGRAKVFNRNDVRVLAMIDAIGASAEQADALWALAATK